MENSIKGHWQLEVVQRVQGLRPNSAGEVGWDQQGLLKAMMAFWKDAFATVLGHPERSYVSELLDVRNKLSHNENFTYDDAERALDSMRRLMEAISAGEVAEQIGKMRDTILRTKFTELARNEERRKTQRLEISVETISGLLPGAKSSSHTRTSPRASSSRRNSLPTLPKSILAAPRRNIAIRVSSLAARI